MSDQYIHVIAGNCLQGDRWAREAGFRKNLIRHVITSTDLAGTKPSSLYVVGTAMRDRRDIMHTIDYAKAVGWRVVFENGEEYH